MLTTQTKYYEDESMFHGFISRVMGTRFELLLIHAGRQAAEELWDGIADELGRLDRMLNRFDPSSEVSRINAGAYGAPVAVSAEMETILRLCRSFYESTGRLFDVTLKDFSQVGFPTPQRIAFGDSALSLDLGGFAKGYALKKIAAMLRQAGVRAGFVDFGRSSILGLGCHPYGSCWKVTLPNPCTGQTLDGFELSNRALSTSGNTARHTAHIVNPLTGLFDNEHKLAAVLSDDPLEAEVLSTVRMIADDTQWARIAPNFKNMQATLYAL